MNLSIRAVLDMIGAQRSLRAAFMAQLGEERFSSTTASVSQHDIDGVGEKLVFAHEHPALPIATIVELFGPAPDDSREFDSAVDEIKLIALAGGLVTPAALYIDPIQ
jgi:hypothetical protein